MSIGRNVYGGVFVPRFDYVKEKHGSDGLAALVKSMKQKGYAGPERAEDFKIGNKYPLDYLIWMMESLLELWGQEEFDRMTRAVARKKGIVGFFVRWAASPATLLRKAGEYWPNFYDFGRLEGEVVGENEGVIRGYDVSPMPEFCNVLTQYYWGILENLRLNGIRVEHVACVHNGGGHCEWKMTWEK